VGGGESRKRMGQVGEQCQSGRRKDETSSVFGRKNSGKVWGKKERKAKDGGTGFGNGSKTKRAGM